LQPASKAPDIAGLLAETRAALAHLRVDELEELAIRAEAMLATFHGPTLNPVALREHRLLGDLLNATSENLRVLRRTCGSAEGNSRWAL
jgi:hypothetical protein